MSAKKLTPKQDKFVTAYLETGNAAEAFRRAFDTSRMLEATIINNAYKLTKRGDIQAVITERREASANAAVLDRAGFINLLTDIATADASEFSEVQIRNCRHCWGIDHRYHWVNEAEHAFQVASICDRNAAARAAWQDRVDQGKREAEPRDEPLPSDEGGYGFDVRGSPNPECPNCHGDGIEHVRFKDTRKLSAKGRRLFQGVKRTKDGLEIKVASQEHARGLLAKWYGIDQPAPAPTVNIQANAPGGTVQVAAVVMPADPLAAAAAYQELMKGTI